MKIILMALIALTLHSKHLHTERYYQEVFCDKLKGKTEVVLEDKTRVDCLTERYAIEVDFAEKWAEAIGQSLHYGLMTERMAGIYLIVEDKNDLKYVQRVEHIAEGHNIEVFYDEEKFEQDFNTSNVF